MRWSTFKNNNQNIIGKSLFVCVSVALHLWRACSGWSHCACHWNTRPGRGTGIAHPPTPVWWQPPETHTHTMLLIQYIHARIHPKSPPVVWRCVIIWRVQSKHKEEWSTHTHMHFEVWTLLTEVWRMKVNSLFSSPSLDGNTFLLKSLALKIDSLYQSLPHITFITT